MADTSFFGRLTKLFRTKAIVTVDDKGRRKVFDGDESPPGFAAIVLIDESHVTAHCYSEKGWLAIDAFTCGSHDPNNLADAIHAKLTLGCEDLKLMKRSSVDRFLHDDLSQNKE